jgi:multiple sugar transport system substrate-binding protein
MNGHWSRRDVLRAGLGAAGLGAAGALLSACGLSGPAAPTGGEGEGMVFLSSQLANTQESEILRRTVLAGFDRPVEFIGATNTSQFVDRIRAEARAGTGNVALVGGVQGEFVALAADGALRDMTDVVEGLSDRGFNEQYLELARIDGRYAFVPWIQASYIMAARREALRFLPAGADVNKLTYDQLLAWTSAIEQATGSARFGLPAGTDGLVKRFLQGYTYPSFTGGVNTTFASPDAVSMWNWVKQVWATANPQSVTYAFMQEPLLSGEVWVAWDHAVRLVDALQAQPDEFVSFPAPTGPRGLGFLPVLGGLGVPNTSPDPDGAIDLITYLTDPAQAATILREMAWFPPIGLDQLPGDLPPGIAAEAATLQAMAEAPDALVSSLPVGLGAQGGAYDQVFIDTFTAIVLDGADIPGVLARQSGALQDVLTTANASCWRPDPESAGVCRVA